MPTIDPQAAPESVRALLEDLRPAIDEELARRLVVPDLEASDPARRLAEAVRYATLGPGKRIRPALCLAACRATGGADAAALPAAAAVELLHAYTLVHDDLPAMDDDDERRGRPTVHVEFGEATAILAGDALLTAAFGALADLGERAAEAVGILAQRAGATELLAGQALDLEAQANSATVSLEARERIHAGKTGALFAAACELGALCSRADHEVRKRLARYGMCLGVVFQLADDIDDGLVAPDFDDRRRQLTSEAIELVGNLGHRAHGLVDLALWFGGAQ